jgi:hypothetical protein
MFYIYIHYEGGHFFDCLTSDGKGGRGGAGDGPGGAAKPAFLMCFDDRMPLPELDTAAKKKKKPTMSRSK